MGRVIMHRPTFTIPTMSPASTVCVEKKIMTQSNNPCQLRLTRESSSSYCAAAIADDKKCDAPYLV